MKMFPTTCASRPASDVNCRNPRIGGFFTFVVIALLGVILAVPASAGPFEAGLAAYHRGDYAAALKNWQPLTEAAYPPAQKLPGAMFYAGNGAPTGPSGKPGFWHGDSNQSAAGAQFQLGRLYEQGKNVPQDDARAAK